MDKVMEGVEVMTEQQGLGDFAPDGGYRMPEGYSQSLSELAESADDVEWWNTVTGETVDEFGRTLEEQLIDNIIFQHWNDRDQHHIHEDYVSDDLHQDSEEDLPLGFYVSYDSGPKYRTFDFDDENRAEWHKDTAIELLEEEGYNALLEEFEK